GRALELAEVVRGDRSVLVLPEERDARRVARMPAAAGLGDVEALRHIPPEAFVDLAITVRHLSRVYSARLVPTWSKSLSSLRALVFDAYGTLFDVHSVISLCEELWPGKGASLSQLWRTKQLEYTWQRSLMRRYEDFGKVTSAGLRYACAALGLELDEERHRMLTGAYLRLGTFPEVREALTELRAMKLRLAILSNGSPAMLRPLVANAGLHNLVGTVISVDRRKTYKPAPEVYRLAVGRLRVPKAAI